MVSHVAVGIMVAVAVGVGAFLWAAFTSSSITNQPLSYEPEDVQRPSTRPSTSRTIIEPHDCTICLRSVERNVRKVLSCGHNFHRNCHEKALESGISLCPVCRKKTM